jgi:hypothetical protein
MRSRILAGGMLAVSVALAVTFGLQSVDSQDMPFGNDKDVQFANNLWKAMEGYTDWPMSSDYYPGQSPHGAFLRLYYNMVNIDGTPYHVIVKDNFGGEGATKETVSESPDKYLVAITPMVQREDGYDPDDNNWFWVKYAPDGSIMKNPKGLALAGKVAKGSSTGCIACHANAKGNDFIFSNDPR